LDFKLFLAQSVYLAYFCWWLIAEPPLFKSDHHKHPCTSCMYVYIGFCGV